MHTVALVGGNGAIDWYCYPHFDSPSIFGRILDFAKGGFYQIHPVCDGHPITNKQMYFPESNVLVTRFLMRDGIVEVEDFIPVAASRGKDKDKDSKSAADPWSDDVYC